MEDTPTPAPAEKGHSLLGQEAIPRETLDTVLNDVLESYQDKPFKAVTQLSNLKRAGIGLSATSEKGAEKKNMIFKHLRDQVEEYNEDGPKLATYLKHLKHIGAIDEEDLNSYKEKIKEAIYDETQDISKLSLLCIDAKYLGFEEDFSQVKARLEEDLNNSKKEDNNESEVALKMARLKYLGLAYDSKDKEAQQKAKEELSEAKIPDKLETLKSNEKWPQYVALRIPLNYLQEQPKLENDTKEKVLDKLNALRVKAQNTNDWRAYSSYAGYLGTIHKQENKEPSEESIFTAPDKDETPDTPPESDNNPADEPAPTPDTPPTGESEKETSNEKDAPTKEFSDAPEPDDNFSEKELKELAELAEKQHKYLEETVDFYGTSIKRGDAKIVDTIIQEVDKITKKPKIRKNSFNKHGLTTGTAEQEANITANEEGEIIGLDVSGLPVSYLPNLNRLKSLRNLSIKDTSFSSIEVFKDVPLEELDIANTKINSLQGLDKFSEGGTITLHENQIPEEEITELKKKNIKIIYAPKADDADKKPKKAQKEETPPTENPEDDVEKSTPEVLTKLIAEPLPQWITDELKEAANDLIKKAEKDEQDKVYFKSIDQLKKKVNKELINDYLKKFKDGLPLDERLEATEKVADEIWQKDYATITKKGSPVNMALRGKLEEHETSANIESLYTLKDIFRKAAFNETGNKKEVLQDLSALLNMHTQIQELKCVTQALNKERGEFGYIQDNVDFLTKQSENERWPEKIRQYIKTNINKFRGFYDDSILK